MARTKRVLKARDLIPYDSFIMAGTVYEVTNIDLIEGLAFLSLAPSDSKPTGFKDTLLTIDERTEIELVSAFIQKDRFS